MSTDILAENGQKLQDAIQFFEDNRYEEAKEIFQSITEEEPKNASAAFYLGRIYMIQDDEIKLAIKWLKKAVKFDEQNSDYHFWLGNAYGQKAQNASIFKAPGLAKKVKKHFLKAVKLDPDNLDARFGLMQYYLQAPGIMGGNDEKGRDQAEEIKKRDPVMGHRAFGSVYEHDEKNDLAEQEYLAAIAEDPDNFIPYYLLGYFYQRTENFEKTFELYEGVLKKNPEETGVLYQIGRSGAISGQNLDRAAECLNLYLHTEPGRDEPSLDWAHYRLGMVHRHAGKIDSAKAHFEAALKINPDHKEVKKALKKLK